MMEDKRGSIPSQYLSAICCSMEKLLKVNSSHAACVQAPNGIMVMGKNFSLSFYFFAHVFNGAKYFFFHSKAI